MKLDHILTPYARINSNRLKTQNHKNPREKHNKIMDISHSNIFSYMSPQVRDTKGK